MIAIIWAMRETDPSENSMVAGAAIGAGLSGFLFAGLFGRHGSRDEMLLAVAGAFLATGLGSFLGGMIWVPLGILFDIPSGSDMPNVTEIILMTPHAGAIAFAVVMFFVPADFPYLVPFWALLMAGVHFVAVLARQRTAACASQNATDRS